MRWKLPDVVDTKTSPTMSFENDKIKNRHVCLQKKSMPTFSFEASWSLVEEFNTQYEELLSQTWLELRPRLFTVQDLAHNWMAKLREVPRDTVTHMLSQEVQRLEQAHPALKAMTGEPFERDHWKILFGLLKMPDIRLEDLRFKECNQCNTSFVLSFLFFLGTLAYNFVQDSKNIFPGSMFHITCFAPGFGPEIGRDR